MTQAITFRLGFGRTIAWAQSCAPSLLASLHALPAPSARVSFQLVAEDGGVALYLSCPRELADHLVAQMHALHADIVLMPCDDPTDRAKQRFAATVSLAKPDLFTVRSAFTEGQDPLAGMIAALAHASQHGQTIVRTEFAPAAERRVKRWLEYSSRLLAGRHPPMMTRILLSASWRRLRTLLWPLAALWSLLRWLLLPAPDQITVNPAADPTLVTRKMAAPCFRTSITITHAGERAWAEKAIKEIGATLSVYADPAGNHFTIGPCRAIHPAWRFRLPRRAPRFLLNAIELAGLVHVPSGAIAESLQRIEARTLPAPITLPQLSSSAGIVLDITNHRGRRDPVVLSHEDRRRHVYFLGKTGMGKTTLMETMIAADLAAGRWLALIDPHGDLAEAVVGNLPKDRINHTIIFDPSDRDRPVGFNMLEAVDAERRPLVASGLVGIFKKLFSDSWGPRLEHTLRSAILALLEYPGATLLSVPLMLTNDTFCAKVVGKVSDPVVRAFWLSEFGRLNPTQRTETVGPILNKVGQFLSSPLMRNILGQPQSAFSLRRAMDQGKTVIVNLSKGKIGEDASALLGAMLVTRFQLDAMSRADVLEAERRDFTLYVDEFQNFATESFATILSEARKYHLSLVMANQYVAQMPEAMRAAVFGNVGSLVAFQVGPSDAPVIKEALQGDVTETDLINAKKHTAYLRLAIDGMPTRAFTADMLPPPPRNREAMAHRYAKVLQVCRSKYANPRSFVTEKIDRLLNDARRDNDVPRPRPRRTR